MAKKTHKYQPNKPVRKQGTAQVRRKEKKETLFSTGSDEFIFDRANFIWMGAGLLFVLLGLLAMSGGRMPDPNTWNPDIIYSDRRITLAPFLMLLGFILVIVGIFKKSNTEAVAESNNPPAA